LWENLRIHHQVFLPRRKELHFLDTHWDRGYEWYLQHFRPRRVRRRLPGEITPAYLVIPEERIEAVHGFNPDVRLIMSIRNPVERAWSAAKYFCRNQKKVDLVDLPFDEFQAIVTTPLMLQRGDYLEGLERWGRVFDPSQLLVVFHDEIITSPTPTLRTVLEHIGANPAIDESKYPLSTIFNAGPERAMPDRHRSFLEELFTDQTAGLAKVFPDRDYDWLVAR
jgi:hypothetical protein